MWLAWVSMAFAKAPEELQPGELWGYWTGWSGNAYTVPKGMFVWHPFIRSGVGLTDFWDLKFSIPGEILGPQIGTELGWSNDAIALSFETRGKTGWTFNALDYNLVPHFTAHLGDKTLFDAALTVQGQAGTKRLDTAQGSVTVENPGLKAVRPELSMDFAASDSVWIILTMRSNVAAWKDEGAQGNLGAYVAYGKDVLGFSLGLNLAVLGLKGFGEGWEQLEKDLKVELWNPPPAVPLPLPHAQIWFRL